jgi:hypothetical protein
MDDDQLLNQTKTTSHNLQRQKLSEYPPCPHTVIYGFTMQSPYVL